MSNTTTSPNMDLPVPVVGTDPSPDWATNINSCLSDIDSHDHSTGKGVPVGVAGINIDGDLTLNGENLTSANSLGLSTLVAADTSLLRTLQAVAVDLYFVDGAGNAVRLTQSGGLYGAQTYTSTTRAVAIAGGTTAPSVTLSYTRYGTGVTAQLSLTTVTKSGGGTFTVSGLVPGILVPTAGLTFTVPVQINSAYAAVRINVASTGDVTIYANVAGSSFSNNDVLVMSPGPSLAWSFAT